MKIALLTDAKLDFNGAVASRFIYIAKEFAKQNIDVTLIGRESEQGIQLKNITVISIPSTNSKNRLMEFLSRLLFPLKIISTCLFKRFDYCIVRGYWIGAVLFPFLKLFRQKAIFDLHGYLYKEQIVEGRLLRAKITRILEGIALSLADKIIVVSKGTKSLLPPTYYNKTIYLPNGVNINEFNQPVDECKSALLIKKYNIKTDKKIVGFVGLWEEWHNIAELLACYKYLNNTQILIVGSGDNLDKLKNEYTNKNIIFTGTVTHSQVKGLLKLIDICVIPYSGNFYQAKIKGYFSSRKTKEYLAAGKPIIVSDIEGKDPFLQEGENMLSYKPGEPKALAQKINQLLNNQSLYDEICRNNLRLAEEFSWKKIITESSLLD